MYLLSLFYNALNIAQPQRVKYDNANVESQ